MLIAKEMEVQLIMARAKYSLERAPHQLVKVISRGYRWGHGNVIIPPRLQAPSLPQRKDFFSILSLYFVGYLCFLSIDFFTFLFCLIFLYIFFVLYFFTFFLPIDYFRILLHLREMPGTIEQKEPIIWPDSTIILRDLAL